MSGKSALARRGLGLTMAALLAGVLAPAAQGCTNDAYRTGPSASLPDCRAYEQVTPVDKPGGSVIPTGQGWAVVATDDGRQLFFNSQGVLLADAPDQAQVIHGVRGSGGWTDTSASPAPVQVGGQMRLGHVDEATGGVVVETPQRFAAGDVDGSFGTDIYAFPSPDASTWLSEGTINNDTMSATVTYVASSADLHRVVFYDTGSTGLLPEDSTRTGADTNALYEWDNGQLAYVGDDGSGTPLTNGQVFAGSPAFTNNALSRDGSRLFFTAIESVGGAPATGKAGLYVRWEDGTVQPIPSAPANADSTYLGATPDGSKVFFSSPDQLVADDVDSTPDLYVESLPSGDVARIASDVGPSAPVYSSDDGSRVYFERSGATYVWDQGAETLVAGTQLLDISNANTKAMGCTEVRLTPDGRYFVASTTASLTPTDTDGGAADVYRFDAQTGKLTLVSTGDASGSTGAYIDAGGDTNPAICEPELDKATTVMSDDGQRIFFETAAPLVPKDTNGKPDVYEWDAATGSDQLISSGTNSEPARLLGSTPSGDDVYFTSDAQLAPTDEDAATDIYDARVGGGFPAPPGPVVECSGADCQQSSSGPPAVPSPGSESATGAGNLPVAAEPRAVTLRLLGIGAVARARAARTGRLALRVRVSAAARLVATARARLGRHVVVVGRRSAHPAHAGTQAMTLTLSAPARRWLARHGRLRLSLVVASGDADGSTSLTLTLTRR